jgi:hypothetical protein
MSFVEQDWEHHELANDQLYAAERDHLMKLEWEEWEREQAQKPATIKVIKQKKDEATHNSTAVRRAHQEKL